MNGNNLEGKRKNRTFAAKTTTHSNKMRQSRYYVTGQSRLTGETVKLTPPCSKDVAERALLRAMRYDLRECSYINLRLERADERQLTLCFDGDTAPQKWFSLYPIVNGCSTEAAYTGSLYECQQYARTRKKEQRDFECIILQDDCQRVTDMEVETLYFVKDSMTATIATNGLRHVSQEPSAATGAITKRHDKLSSAISYLESRGYRIDTTRFQKS